MLQLLESKYGRKTAEVFRPQLQEQYVVATCADRPDLFDTCVAIEDEAWDALGFLDYTPAHHAHYNELLALFPDFHLCMLDTTTGDVVATGMCVPLCISVDQPLPDEGWDWVVNTACEQGGKQSNAIGALSISVPASLRHRGLARDLINTMRALAGLNTFRQVIAPVRPSEKCRHPFVAMREYIEWRDERGRIFDPWLRSHVSVGGRVEGVCDHSMVVEQPLEFWKRWIGDLDRDGPTSLAGALAPLVVEGGVGRYVEPNVWVRHAV